MRGSQARISATLLVSEILRLCNSSLASSVSIMSFTYNMNMMYWLLVVLMYKLWLLSLCFNPMLRRVPSMPKYQTLLHCL